MSEFAAEIPVPNGSEWWRTAVVYQIYPKSFADGNGDGVGDLPGITSRLDYLRALGVDALWLSPFYRSPMADGGYDVADPMDVDPSFGTIADFDAMLAKAQSLGLRVTVDIVPNHLSNEHPWFQAALKAAPGSPERALFIFRDGRGEGGDLPPNNWPSVFGGPAWHRVSEADGTPGQWYLHFFAPEQPDLNWLNPAVADYFEQIMRFWLDRGVDGFRVDVAHSMAKPDGLPDMPPELIREVLAGSPSAEDPRWDQEGVHEIHRRFRRTLDSYPGQRMAIGESWVPAAERLARYVRPDELNLTFNFELLEADWGLGTFEKAIASSLEAMAEVGAPCSWVLSNHDVVRHITRYGGGALGQARGRAAALLQLALPGSAYIYNGDELGLENVDLPDEALQDPTWERSGHTERGRDGERVPMPWSGGEPPYGFSSQAQTWLPMPASWAALTAAAQDGSPSSTLNLYRQALALRRELEPLRHGTFAWVGAPDECLSFRRGSDIVVATNFSSQPSVLPPGALLLSSGELPGDGSLPGDTTVWLREVDPQA